MANPRTKGKPFWFKLYMDDANLIRNSSPKAIADAMKALLCLMEDPGYDPAELSKPARMLFSQLRRGVDEATEEYRRSCEAGKRGNEIRWGKVSPPDGPPIHPDPEPEPNPEQEQEQEQEQNQELYPERKEERKRSFPFPFATGEEDDEGFLPWEREFRSRQMEDLRKGFITVNELVRFPPDVSWPPECARNYV